MEQRKLPYEVDYSTLKTWRTIKTVLLWLIFIIPIVSPILIQFKEPITCMDTILTIASYINFVLMIAYFIIDIICEAYLYPATARNRRKGFFDNSLGTKLLESPVQGYYSNDEITNGDKKVLVNCAENCFFTYEIAKAMQPKSIIKNAIFFIFFLGFAFYGINNSSIAIPVLQLLLSSIFLSELVYLVLFVAKLRNIYEKYLEAFGNISDEMKTKGNAYFLLLEYETALAYNRAPADSDKIYKKKRESLNTKWREIKERYGIR